MRLVLTNATLIDCVDPNPVAGASVVIEDGRIAEITNGSRSPSTQDAQVIDLGGAYLLPGLWDVPHSPRLCHRPQHHRGPADGPVRAEPDARHGRGGGRGCPLRRGPATSWTWLGGTLLLRVNWDGPRVFACGNFLTTTGGHFLTSGHARECDGPYGFVNAVREQIKNGVDHIQAETCRAA